MGKGIGRRGGNKEGRGRGRREYREGKRNLAPAVFLK